MGQKGIATISVFPSLVLPVLASLFSMNTEFWGWSLHSLPLSLSFVFIPLHSLTTFPKQPKNRWKIIIPVYRSFQQKYKLIISSLSLDIYLQSDPSSIHFNGLSKHLTLFFFNFVPTQLSADDLSLTLHIKLRQSSRNANFLPTLSPHHCFLPHNLQKAFCLDVLNIISSRNEWYWSIIHPLIFLFNHSHSSFIPPSLSLS